MELPSLFNNHPNKAKLIPLKAGSEIPSHSPLLGQVHN